MTPLHAIRERHEADDPALLAIENRAAAMFAAHGYPQVAANPIPDLATLQRLTAGRAVHVAVDAHDRPLGFAVSGATGGIWWLHELSVDPGSGRQGVGTALLDAVVERARWAFHTAVGLSTFRDVPFNRPFYERRGFMIHDVASAPADIRAQFEAEVPDGVSPLDRVLMLRRL